MSKALFIYGEKKILNPFMEIFPYHKSIVLNRSHEFFLCSFRMASVYLKSIRQPFNRSFYDISGTQRTIKKNNFMYQESYGENSQYELDSFCVGTTNSETGPSIQKKRENERFKNNHEVENEDNDPLRTIDEQVAGPSLKIKSKRPFRKRIISPNNDSSSQ